jgi:hypothetical protein
MDVLCLEEDPLLLCLDGLDDEGAGAAALILEDVLRAEDVLGLAEEVLDLDEDTADAVGFGLADPPDANADDDFLRAEDMIEGTSC